MAEHTEPAATQVAGIIGMAIYNRLPVVAKGTGVVGSLKSEFHPCVSCSNELP
jgi:hypothetical protein